MIKLTFLAAARSAARRRRATRAFSIPQLLSYSAASALLVVVANASLLSSIRSNSDMELYQRAEERWSRISSLIQSEVSEASEILYNVNFVCLGSSTGGGTTQIFALKIPYLKADQSASNTFIYYSQVGSGASAELRRCGFGYSADGKLRFTDTRNTFSTVGLRTDLVITNPATDSFTFTLNIYTPSNQLILSRSATATAGVELAEICNADETKCEN